MRRAGFALIEILLVVGMVGTMTGLAIPLYRDYQIRNDLNLATEQVTQGLARARLLSESAQNDDAWGFYIPAGTLYKGTAYATRNSQYDEVYAMPSTIMTTGLSEVSYQKLTGDPSGTGSITLVAINQDSRTILIVVEKESLAVVQNDRITICHQAGHSYHTLTINENAWPAHQNHGDTLGACSVSSSSAMSSVVTASSAVSSITSSSSSSASSTAMTSSAVSSITSSSSSSSSATCADRFSVASDGTITTTGTMSVRFDSLGAAFGYGNGGPNVPVKVAYKKTSNGNSWTNLFSGNAINGNGGATQTVSGFSNGDKVILRFWAKFSQRGWLSYDRKIYSNDSSSNVLILRNGDLAPSVSGVYGQTAVSTLIQSITVNGYINIGTYDLLMLADFNRQDVNNCADYFCSNGSLVDYQDGVVLVKFLTPSC